jgi:hypothetical protein
VSAFQGVYPPVLTSFRGGEAADDRLASNLARLNAHPLAGISGRYGIGGLKAALDLLGGYGEVPRAPLPTPDADGVEEIREVLATVGLL